MSPEVQPPIMSPPTRGLTNLVLKIWLVVSSLVLVGLVALIVVLLYPESVAENTTPAIKETSQFDSSQYSTEPCEYTNSWPKVDTDNVRYWCMSERANWPELKAAYEGVCDAVCPDRMAKDAEGSSKAYIKEKFNLDTSEDADYQYMVAMSLIVSRDYTVDEIEFAHRAMYANEIELDAITIMSTKRLEETWNRFLAHDDLGYTFNTTFNGKPFKYDGKYTGQNSGVSEYKPITDQKTNDNGITVKEPIRTQTPDVGSSDIATLEAWSRSYHPTSPGADGTYKEAIGAYASKFGMELDYNFDHVYDGCPISRGMDETYIEAAYCHGTPNKIFINNRFIQYDRNLKTPRVVDTVKHEMAHHLIGVICYTSQPQIARTSSVEAVTSSFAVLFLGADRTYLNTSTTSEYQMTSQTDEIARLIHDKHQCSSY